MRKAVTILSSLFEKPRLIFYAALALIVALAGPAYAGNGMPNSPDYLLNIHAHETCPGDDMKGTNRKTIFVKLNYSRPNPNNIAGDSPGEVTLDRTNKIFLYPGDFKVLDGNACDGDGAMFQLPANSSPGPDGQWGTADDILYGAVYEIWLRELGKPQRPGEESYLTTCAFYKGADGVIGGTDDEIVCSSDNVVMLRDTGKPKVQNVTKELTSLDLVIGGQTVTVPIFDSRLYQYFWDYDNNGLRLVQLRFFLR